MSCCLRLTTSPRTTWSCPRQTTISPLTWGRTPCGPSGAITTSPPPPLEGRAPSPLRWRKPNCLTKREKVLLPAPGELFSLLAMWLEEALWPVGLIGILGETCFSASSAAPALQIGFSFCCIFFFFFFFFCYRFISYFCHI